MGKEAPEGGLTEPMGLKGCEGVREDGGENGMRGAGADASQRAAGRNQTEQQGRDGSIPRLRGPASSYREGGWSQGIAGTSQPSRRPQLRTGPWEGGRRP